MIEKKINELSDEALDAVTGGAEVRENPETGMFDLYSASGEYVTSYDDKKSADFAAVRYEIRHERFDN